MPPKVGSVVQALNRLLGRAAVARLVELALSGVLDRGLDERTSAKFTAVVVAQAALPETCAKLNVRLFRVSGDPELVFSYVIKDGACHRS